MPRGLFEAVIGEGDLPLTHSEVSEVTSTNFNLMKSITSESQADGWNSLGCLPSKMGYWKILISQLSVWCFMLTVEVKNYNEPPRSFPLPLSMWVSFNCSCWITCLCNPSSTLQMKVQSFWTEVVILSVQAYRWLSGKESACQSRSYRRRRINPWVGKFPWRKKWQPTPVFLPGESHGQRSLTGHSPRDRKSWTQLIN